MNVVVVVQARTGSTRLPGKILLPLAGKPLLLRMLERVRAASTPFRIVVATTTEPSDDPVEDLCRNEDIAVYRGHPTDLLDRHYRAALPYGPDAVVKIPSDCPLIDPAVIDSVLSAFLTSYPQYDFASNLHPASFPDGNDVEIMKFATLHRAWEEATRDFEREHTTPFIWERPDQFSLCNISYPGGKNLSMTHRWTIDYPDDYRFIARIYDELWKPENPLFTMADVLQLLTVKPDLAGINSRYAGVNWYRNYLHELKTVKSSETKTDITA